MIENSQARNENTVAQSNRDLRFHLTLKKKLYTYEKEE